MKKFLTHLLKFCLAVLLILAVSIGIFWVNCTVPIPKNNIVLLGDSTGKATIDTKIVKNIDNFSQGGEAYFFTYMKLRELIKTKKPDTILVNFSTINLFKPQEIRITAEGRARYLPLLTNEEHLMLAKANFGNYLRNWLEVSAEIFALRHKPSISFGSYTANPGAYQPFEYDPQISTIIPKLQVEYLDKTIALAKKNNITVVLFDLPKYSKDANFRFYDKPEFYQLYDTHYSDIPFLNFRYMQLSGKSSFRDMVHTNDVGAKKFSEFLNKHSIKELLSSDYNYHRNKNDHGTSFPPTSK